MNVQFIYLACNNCDKVFRSPYYKYTQGCHHQDYEDTKEVFAAYGKCYETTNHDILHLHKTPTHHPFTEAMVGELCQCPDVGNPLRAVIDFPDPDRWEGWFDRRQRQNRTLDG